MIRLWEIYIYRKRKNQCLIGKSRLYDKIWVQFDHHWSQTILLGLQNSLHNLSKNEWWLTSTDSSHYITQIEDVFWALNVKTTEVRQKGFWSDSVDTCLKSNKFESHEKHWLISVYCVILYNIWKYRKNHFCKLSFNEQEILSILLFNALQCTWIKHLQR